MYCDKCEEKFLYVELLESAEGELWCKECAIKDSEENGYELDI